MAINFNRLVEIGYALFDKDKLKSRCYHLSAIYYKNKLICLAQNSIKTNPTNLLNPRFYENRQFNGSRGSCSELNVLTKLKNKTNIPFNKCVLINLRIDRNLDIGMSCPCSSCKNLLRWANMKAIYFSNKDGNFEKFVL